MDLDFLLIQRMRMGDEKAIEIFVKKYYEKILKYCQVHLSCSSDAEDLVQETFLHFFLCIRPISALWEGSKLFICDCNKSL